MPIVVQRSRLAVKVFTVLSYAGLSGFWMGVGGVLIATVATSLHIVDSQAEPLDKLLLALISAMVLGVGGAMGKAMWKMSDNVSKNTVAVVESGASTRAMAVSLESMARSIESLATQSRAQTQEFERLASKREEKAEELANGVKAHIDAALKRRG